MEIYPHLVTAVAAISPAIWTSYPQARQANADAGATGTRAGRPFLAVTSTGPVIAAQDVARLLRPFERLVPGRTHGHQPGGDRGLGLGLAIVTAIAAAHNAELSTVAQPAGGLAMEIVFPPRPAEPRRAEPGPAEVLV